MGELLDQALARQGVQKSIRAAQEKKIAALDNFFAGRFHEGYQSLKQAYADYRGIAIFDVRPEDVLAGLGLYDSQRRASESVDTATWDQVLGDSITRRMVALYKSQADLQTWRSVVSSLVPINDFRTQHVTRTGGYGLLPVVNEGAPFQPLNTPTDEESTYKIAKRGGTEDLTLEAVANDDVHKILRIPQELARSAALTVHRFVWDLLATNAVCTFDSTALFAAGHGNTDAGAPLAQSTLSAGRRKIRKQTAYGDPSDLLGAVPKYLVVPPELEEIAFQLCTSVVALGAGAGTTSGANASDIPNIHQGVEPIVIEYWSDPNDWFLVADPVTVPTIEMGFYQGRVDPELFTQNDPVVGAAFSSDKVTFKIRHIYSGTILDYRGMYRGQG